MFFKHFCRFLFLINDYQIEIHTQRKKDEITLKTISKINQKSEGEITPSNFSLLPDHL